MAYPVLEGWTDNFDFVNTIILQRNSCPICHLPLLYSAPYIKALDQTQSRWKRALAYASPNQWRKDADYYWAHIQYLMKSGVENESNLYGIRLDKKEETNAQRCHYVSSTMVPELTRPVFYETPAVTCDMSPENGYYLKPNQPRTEAMHRLFNYDMQILFPNPIPPYRLARLSNFLSMTGTKWFLGCKDCNAMHTGHTQLRNIVKSVHAFQWAEAEEGTSNMHNMYTLLFDCMAEYNVPGPPHIVVDEYRAATWQVELWINYCSIMFMAQHASNVNREKLKTMGPNNYAFHYAHRDMGLCDFYMSQILAAILYCNHDIDVDFIWLHQNFLCQLAIWARKNNLFDEPTLSSHCLWRLVMGNPEVNVDVFPVYTDVANLTDPADPTKVTYADNHKYWWDDPNYANFGRTVTQKVTEFSQTWLKYIGMVISTGNQRYGIPTKGYDDTHFSARDNALLDDLFAFFNMRCELKFYKDIRCFSNQVKTIDGHTDAICRLLMDPNVVVTLSFMEKVFQCFENAGLPPNDLTANISTIAFYKQFQYENFVKLAVSRNRAYGAGHTKLIRLLQNVCDMLRAQGV